MVAAMSFGGVRAAMANVRSWSVEAKYCFAHAPDVGGPALDRLRRVGAGQCRGAVGEHGAHSRIGEPRIAASAWAGEFMMCDQSSIVVMPELSAPSAPSRLPM